MIELRNALHEDIPVLLAKLRQADRDELALTSLLPADFLIKRSIDQSELAVTALVDDELAAVFGYGKPALGNHYTLWLLGTDILYRKPITFTRIAKRYIQHLAKAGRFCNYVSVDNTVTIRWLKLLGARFGPVEPAGVNGALFQYFEV